MPFCASTSPTLSSNALNYQNIKNLHPTRKKNYMRREGREREGKDYILEKKLQRDVLDPLAKASSNNSQNGSVLSPTDPPNIFHNQIKYI